MALQVLSTFNEKARDKARTDAERFLVALEQNVQKLAKLSRKVEEEASAYDVSSYDTFREELQNFRSLGTLIEGRLQELAGEKKAEELGEQFQKMNLLMLTLYIKTSLKTFFVYSAKAVLSLGSKERFISDLRFLKEAEEKLSNPPYVGRLSDDAMMELEMAQAVLEEIVAKAPGLLDFGLKR